MQAQQNLQDAHVQEREKSFFPQGLSAATYQRMRRMFVFSFLLALLVASETGETLTVDTIIQGIKVDTLLLKWFLFFGLTYYWVLSFLNYRLDEPHLNSFGAAALGGYLSKITNSTDTLATSTTQIADSLKDITKTLHSIEKGPALEPLLQQQRELIDPQVQKDIDDMGAEARRHSSSMHSQKLIDRAAQLASSFSSSVTRIDVNNNEIKARLTNIHNIAAKIDNLVTHYGKADSFATLRYRLEGVLPLTLCALVGIMSLISGGLVDPVFSSVLSTILRLSG